MKVAGKLLALILSTLLLCAALPACAADYVEGEVLVLTKSSGAATAAANLSAAGSAASVRCEAQTFVQNIERNVDAQARPLRVFTGLSSAGGKTMLLMSTGSKTTDEMVSTLKKRSDVAAVSRNYIRHLTSTTPNDPKWKSQWGTKRIKTNYVWDSTIGSQDVVVAVIDSGIMNDHPDLSANMWSSGGVYGRMFHHPIDPETGKITSSVDTYSGNTISADAKAVNGTAGSDLYNLDYSTVGDLHGHGTFVAGIIGAVGNNSAGIAGVNWHVKLLNVGVCTMCKDSGNWAGNLATDADIIAGMDYVTELKYSGKANIRVANISIGGWVKTGDAIVSLYQDALNKMANRGIIVCMAAGNESQNFDDLTDAYKDKLCYPACLSTSTSITVGASDISDGKDSYSNYSSSGSYVQIFAPGSDIISTCRYTALANGGIYSSTGYTTDDGTSFAAPMVSGAAALLCALYPDKSAAEIRALLLNNAEDLLKSGYSGYGFLNVAKAAGVSYSDSDSSSSGGSSDDGGGGGGCSAGFALLALLALPSLPCFGRKKK